MLPGFNHNVRHQDRVFHVQTEDNGVTQARLVTQIFISGQLVAIERGSYADIIEQVSDDKTRTEQIRLRMQEQHKSQMKRLVSGELDERIRTLFGDTETVDAVPEAPAAEPAAPSLVGAEVIAAAQALPLAPAELPPPEPQHPALMPRQSKSEPEAARQSHPDFLIELDEEMRRQIPWRPTEQQLEAGGRFAEEASETVSMDIANGLPPLPRSPSAPKTPAQAAQPPPQAPPPKAAPPPQAPATTPPPLRAPPARGPSTAHGRRPSASPPPQQAPAAALPPKAAPPRRPSAAPPAQPTPAQRAAASWDRPRRGAPDSTVPLPGGAGPGRPRPGAGRALPRRPAFPAAQDTVVDMSLPAGLKETIEKRRQAAAQRPPSQPPTAAPPPVRRPAQTPPPQAEAPTPVDMRFRPGRGLQGSPNDTMLEVDAAELHAQIAAQRARLKKQQEAAAEGQPPAPDADGKPGDPKDRRGNLVVYERSLDDVIMGYLSDDE